MIQFDLIFDEASHKGMHEIHSSYEKMNFMPSKRKEKFTQLEVRFFVAYFYFIFFCLKQI